MNRTRVSASVTSGDPTVIARAVESLARAVAGLALEGADVVIIAGPEEDDDDEGEGDEVVLTGPTGTSGMVDG